VNPVRITGTRCRTGVIVRQDGAFAAV